MIGYVSRAFFNTLARSRTLQHAASRYGMRSRDSFAGRFIAGETVEEAIEASRAVEAQGLLLTLDYLGESVRTAEEADAATREYIRMLDVTSASGIERNISLKLTQLGAGVDRATCVDNLRRILDGAAAHDFFVRVDMENSEYTQVTLDIFETVWQQGYRNAGIVLQAYLKRSADDAARLNAIGARVRLVKGAYQEPKNVAYQKKEDVDAAYARMLKVLISDGHYPAIATHDPSMIALARAWAAERGVAPDRFEFQLLYGIRRDLQAQLVNDGYLVRVYVPFGREWFPYFMRRLGERPANVAFVVRGVTRETG